MKNVKKIFGFVLLIMAFTTCRKEVKEPVHKLAGRNIVYIEIGEKKYLLKANREARLFNRKHAGNHLTENGVTFEPNDILLIEVEGSIKLMSANKDKIEYKNTLSKSRIVFDLSGSKNTTKNYPNPLDYFVLEAKDNYLVETDFLEHDFTFILNKNEKKKYVEGYYIGRADSINCYSCNKNMIKIYFDCKY
jgi:hypothetical protein